MTKTEEERLAYLLDYTSGLAGFGEKRKWAQSGADNAALRRQVEELQTLAQEMLDYIIGLAGKCECGGPLMATSICVQCQARARVSSLMGLGWNIGWSVGPYLSGLIQMRTGFSPIFLITAGTYVVGSVLPYAFFAKADPVPLRQPAFDRPDSLG